MESHDTLAKTLAESTPSAGVFDQLRVDRLSDTGLFDALVASEKLARYAAGLQTRVLAVLASQCTRHHGLEAGAIEAEVIAATRWAPSLAKHRLETAGVLADRFPETLALLCAGQITWPQAVAMVEITASLNHESARRVQERVLSRLAGQSTAATRKALRRAVLAADPDGAAQRHAAAAARRRLEMRPEEDGMATLELYTTAPTAAAMMAAVKRAARKTIPGDPRTADQRRADVFARLLLAGAGVQLNGTQGSDNAPALVHVVVGLETLIAENDEPGRLEGYGPITAQQARALAFAPGSVWRRLITAPDGKLLHIDARTYRPTASVARLVTTRDQHCTFPGCAMPAQRCDLDHIEPFNHKAPQVGGASTPENLHALCRRHHRLKTAGMWAVERADGATVWTSRTGRTYRTEPPTYAAA